MKVNSKQSKKKLISEDLSKEARETRKIWVDIMVDWHLKNQALGIHHKPSKHRK